MALGNGPVTPAKTGLDEDNDRTVSQRLKKTVVHPFTESNPLKIIIDSHNGNYGYIYLKILK